MRSKLFRLLKWTAGLLVVAVLGLLAIRAYDAQRGPPLSRWHTYTPHDLTAKQISKIEWAEYVEGGERALRRGAGQGHREAGTRGADPGEPLLRRQPDLSGALRHRLESLLHPGAGRRAGRCGRPAARADRFPLQPAARRAPLPGARLGQRRDPAAGARHRAGRPDRRRVGGLVGGHAPRRAGGAPPHRPVEAPAPGRVLQRRRARDEVRARRPRRQDADAAPIASC